MPGSLSNVRGIQTEKFYFAHKRSFLPENFAQKCRKLSQIIEGREGGGGVTIPFPTRNFSKIPVPVGFLLKIPVEVIKIPVNKK